MRFFSRRVRIHIIAWALVISVALYVLSFFANAVYSLYMTQFGHWPSIFKGWEAFFFVPSVLAHGQGPADFEVRQTARGWLLACRILMCWLANPLFFTGVLALLLGYRHLPWIAAAGALFLASIFLFEYEELASPIAGFYLWLVSMAMLTFTALYRAVARPPKPVPASR